MAVHHFSVNPNVVELFQRFWEIEEVPNKTHLTPEEEKCETHFISSHSRMESGQYIVRLPFKDGPPLDIGVSYSRASFLYNKLERRLSINPILSNAHNEFLTEYKQLRHMESVHPHDIPHYSPVYIPDHPILKEDSTTTRIRVVFNASNITSNGTSLNDHFMIGPKLQNDLPSILMRWRRHRLVYTADIEKMYRQILVNPMDTNFQRILWRPNLEAQIKSYRLNTVTYGTACAPYLALLVLKQLSHDEGNRFPLAAHILDNDLYVDDALFGADNVESAREIRQQLSDLLPSGGFHLRKWASNYSELLEEIPAGKHELAFDQSVWHPASDCFKFKIQLPEKISPTKRMILSIIARLYDPLGWVTPIIITAKIIMQQLWLRKIDWDSEIPFDLLTQWFKYCTELPLLNQLNIPRSTGQSSSNFAIELHGFADASSKVYGAVVYLRVLNELNNAHITLLCAKSKVAPIKTLSIPKLELNAAVLLIKTISYIQEAMQLTGIPIYCWSDSIVVLGWISQHPSRYEVFIGNRVTEIQTRVPQAKWRHVPSEHNPADSASRGSSTSELLTQDLWRQGPHWLKLNSFSWSELHALSNEDTELGLRKVSAHFALKEQSEWQFSPATSSWPRLLRITLLYIVYGSFVFEL